ncbi:branched-chain amino acid ABC transporter permease [Nonomuraea ferruginea]
MNWDIILSTTLKAAIGVETVWYALAAIGINIHFGYTGLLNFGQSAFLAVAGYGLAVTVTVIGLPFWIGIGVGLVAAVLLAFLLGIPTLRLRADYLAIVTIAAAEIVRLIFRSVEFKSVFGGSDG